MPEPPSPLRFGVIADCQFADTDEVYLDRHLRLSSLKLTEAADQFGEDDSLAFVVNLGDLIDRGFRNFDRPLAILESIGRPVYHVLGNHDFDVAPELKASVRGRLGLESGAYSFTGAGWRFIVLDGGEMSIFAHAEDSQGFARSSEWRNRLPQELRPAIWNGGLGEAQRVWLEEQLQAAEDAHEPVVILCHFPIANDRRFVLWDADEVGAVVQRHRATVKAWFCAHHHVGGYSHELDTHHFNFVGMVDTSRNAFATVELTAESIRIHGHARQPDALLPL